MIDGNRSGDGQADRSQEHDANAVPEDDAHKTEKLTKSGRDDFDPDEASD